MHKPAREQGYAPEPTALAYESVSKLIGFLSPTATYIKAWGVMSKANGTLGKCE